MGISPSAAATGSRSSRSKARRSSNSRRGRSTLVRSSVVSTMFVALGRRAAMASSTVAFAPTLPSAAASSAVCAPLAFSAAPLPSYSSPERLVHASTTTARRFSTTDSSSTPQSSSSSPDPNSAKPLTHSLPSLGDAYALPADCPVGLAGDVLTDLRPGRRIVSFGDVHGDLDALRTFLVTAGVMDPRSTLEDPVWSGEDTICVQVGDVLDRGDDELACLRALSSLSRQAKDAGGALVLLYGNHESLNAAGLFQYANPGGNVEFENQVGRLIDGTLGTDRWRLQFAGNQPSRWAMYEPGGLLADQMLANMKVAVVVGKTVFVHAGLTADHVRKYNGIEGMNRQVREWILNAAHEEHNPHGTYATVQEVIQSAQTRARSISGNMPECLGAGGAGLPSPVWMRDYSTPSDGPPKNPEAGTMMDDCLREISRRIRIDAVARRIEVDGEVIGSAEFGTAGAGTGGGVDRMVVGHTPQRRINAALGGRAVRVDVGASRGVMGGMPEVLEIYHGAGPEGEDLIHVLTAGGERIPLSERTVVDVGMPLEQLL